jgi:hypothetical protein
MNYFATKMIDFYAGLNLKLKKSKEVQVLNPFKEDDVMDACHWFHNSYYKKEGERIFLFGINPGRYGAGVTGIPFTDPIQIEALGFKNEWQKRHELSAVYIEDLIESYEGGRKKFSDDFYISSICPLGFIKDGKNINYYDEKNLIEDTEAFIVKKLKAQIEAGARTDICFSLGKGKNYKYFQALNERTKLFDKIVPLPHPRWVMQYNRKDKEKHISSCLEALSKSIHV